MIRTSPPTLKEEISWVLLMKTVISGNFSVNNVRVLDIPKQSVEPISEIRRDV
jgi:hypothetical protein